MPIWDALFARPAALDEATVTAWFDRIAAQLLCSTRLDVAGAPHRLTEIEFYYYDARHHPDPFTHRDPVQFGIGRWYFHKTGGTYRGGSFKGIDLTFGSEGASGGVLIRGLERPDGTLVDGPSLCVDHLVAASGHTTVAALDAAIAGRLAWDISSKNPLPLRETEAESRTLLSTARIGLALRRSKPDPEGPRYVVRRYRHLSEPRRIAKGKAHAVLALHIDGTPPAQIHALTGCPLPTVTRHIADFEAGRRVPDFDAYYDLDPKPPMLGRMHGTDHALRAKRR